MRYIMTAVWAVVISLVVSYVLTSMAGEPIVLTEILLLAALFVIASIVLGEGILKEEKE